MKKTRIDYSKAPTYPSVVYTVAANWYGYSYVHTKQPLVVQQKTFYHDEAKRFRLAERTNMVIAAIAAHPEHLRGLLTLAKVNRLNVEFILRTAWGIGEYHLLFGETLTNYYGLLTKSYQLIVVAVTPTTRKVLPQAFDPSSVALDDRGVSGRTSPLPNLTEYQQTIDTIPLNTIPERDSKGQPLRYRATLQVMVNGVWGEPIAIAAPSEASLYRQVRNHTAKCDQYTVTHQ